MRPAQRLPQFVNEFDRDRREIVDEVERIFHLVRDAGSQLTKRCQLLGLNQTVLCSPQVLQRLRQFASASFYAFKQPYILDGDCGLVGKRPNQFDLLVGKRSHLVTCQRQNADRNPLA